MIDNDVKPALSIYTMTILTLYPGEAHAADGPGEHVCEDAGEGVAGGEVGMEPGVLPVGHAHLVWLL